MTSQRAFDLLLALMLVIPALLLCVAAAFIIWLESRANPLLIQSRVGVHCRPFMLFKLRTMRPNTPDAASHDISPVQILVCGRYLRACKLDELPQILNVINGTMSFVGPRPCLASQTDLIAERQRRGVMEVLPGITGTSQIAGIDMSDPVRLAISDAKYVKRRSIGLYLYCLIATFVGKGSGDAVKNA